jgi:hypothetical protein
MCHKSFSTRRYYCRDWDEPSGLNVYLEIGVTVHVILIMAAFMKAVE